MSQINNKRIIALSAITLLTIEHAYAIDVIAPDSSAIVGNGTEFIWNSSDGSYCWENSIQVYDSTGNLIDDSGSFNPRGGDSTYTVSGITVGQPVTVDINCNPTQLTTIVYETQTQGGTTGGTTGGDSTGGTTGVSTSGNVTGQIDLQYDSGVTLEQMQDMTGSILMAFATAFIFRMILKQMR